MILLQYKFSKRGGIQVKVFLSKATALAWLGYDGISVVWHEMRQITGVVTITGEVYTEFLESERNW